jgi:hypothetical protein
MTDDEICFRLVELSRSGLPREMPGAPVGQLQGRETMLIASCRGHRCSVCETTITGEDAALSIEYRYPTGTVHFHARCHELWDEERHRPIRRRE